MLWSYAVSATSRGAKYRYKYRYYRYLSGIESIDIFSQYRYSRNDTELAPERLRPAPERLQTAPNGSGATVEVLISKYRYYRYLAQSIDSIDTYEGSIFRTTLATT